MFNCRRRWPGRGSICNAASAKPPGDPGHPEYARWVREAQTANLIVSPLFLWVVGQPNGSVSYESLFERASDQYGDPFVALGAIAWMTMVDAEMGHRQRGAVLSRRLQPLALRRDRAGDHYHVWGFLLKALNGEGMKYRVLSFVAERLMQQDGADWMVDRMAVSFGYRTLNAIREPGSCARVLSP